MKVLGIVIVSTFATLLALVDSGNVNAAMGILGGVAGYIFGVRGAANEPG